MTSLLQKRPRVEDLPGLVQFGPRHAVESPANWWCKIPIPHVSCHLLITLYFWDTNISQSCVSGGNTLMGVVGVIYCGVPKETPLHPPTHSFRDNNLCFGIQGATLGNQLNTMDTRTLGVRPKKSPLTPPSKHQQRSDQL